MKEVFRFNNRIYIKSNTETDDTLMKCGMVLEDSLSVKTNPNKIFSNDEFRTYLKENFSEYLISENTDFIFCSNVFYTLDLFKVKNNVLVDVCSLVCSYVNGDVVVASITNDNFKYYFIDNSYSLCYNNIGEVYLLDNINNIIEGLEKLK